MLQFKYASLARVQAVQDLPGLLCIILCGFQVYEDTSGLTVGDGVTRTGKVRRLKALHDIFCHVMHVRQLGNCSTYTNNHHTNVTLPSVAISQHLSDEILLPKYDVNGLTDGDQWV